MASPSGDPLEAALDELFGCDSADFVTSRKQIAARLRSAGAKAEAKAVLAARRPTAAAAALNQLARDQPRLIADFLERSTQLRDSFRVSREAVRTATVAHRDALRTITDAALARLGNRSDAYRSQIQSTLHAAGVDTDVAQSLRAGRIEKEVTGPSGFAETELAVPLDADERRTQLQAALEAAETDATDAAAELETARRIETDLEAQLRVAHDQRQRAETRTRETRAAVTAIHAQLKNETDARRRPR